MFTTSILHVFLTLYVSKKIDPIFEKIFVVTMKMFMFHKSSCIPFLNPRTPFNVEQEMIDFHRRNEFYSFFCKCL